MTAPTAPASTAGPPYVVRFAALGDSLTSGVGDPLAGGRRRGWAALLCGAGGTDAVPGGGLAAVRCAGPDAGAGVALHAVAGAGPDAGSGDGADAVPSVGPYAGIGAAPHVVAGEAPDAPPVRQRVVAFQNFAVSGALTRDVEEQQAPAALAFRPDLASVVVGVNDTLRRAFDIQDVALRLDRIYGELAAHGAVLLTACLPDPGTMLGLPGPLARPLARRQRAVNAVVHALSARYDSVHLHMSDAGWVADRSLWSADRLHPGERGHRVIAARFHELLAERGFVIGAPPALATDRPPPSRLAAWRWLATAGTGWVVRRCRDLLPDLLRLAADEVRHRARGTGARLDQRAELALSHALAALTPLPAVQRPTGTNRTGVPGTACAAPARSAALTTAITG